MICTIYDLAHVAGWEPHTLHDPGHVPRVGSVLLICRYATPLTTAGGELCSRTTVDHDLSARVVKRLKNALEIKH